MTHPFTTDEADYRRLCRAAEQALTTWHAYRLFSHRGNYKALCEVMRALSDALDTHDSAPTPVPPPGRRVLIDGRECTLVELEDGR